MRKVITIIKLCAFCVLIFGCSKGDSNDAPSNVSLTYPTDDLLCIDNTIAFDWSDAVDKEGDEIEYKISIATDRSMTDIVQTNTITDSQVSLTLSKSTAYYWQVYAIDENENESDASEIYAFYTSGDGVENYAPFSSELVSPENVSEVSAGSINLTWLGSDANTGDTLSYELYFGEDANLELIDENLTSTSYNVTIESGKTYSWKVNVKDQNEAKSIGQIWSFTAN